MHGQQVHAKPDWVTPQTYYPYFVCLPPPARSTTRIRSTPQGRIGNAIDEREVPSVSDDAPATKGRGMKEALNSMHEAERKTPAYPKLDFPEVSTTFNFTNKETEIPRELFGYFFPDSELQTRAGGLQRDTALPW
jgi:hypothetical protein